jgi:hypothetical protein
VQDSSDAARRPPFSQQDAQRSWHFRQLRWSLQGLAAAGSPQRKLFPDQAATPDDLAFDFDHWASVIGANYDADLSPAQREALSAIERKLATMSRDGAEFDVDLWTEAALRGSVHWADIRRLAGEALDAFGWLGDDRPVDG